MYYDAVVLDVIFRRYKDAIPKTPNFDSNILLS